MEMQCGSLLLPELPEVARVARVAQASDRLTLLHPITGLDRHRARPGMAVGGVGAGAEVEDDVVTAVLATVDLNPSGSRLMGMPMFRG